MRTEVRFPLQTVQGIGDGNPLPAPLGVEPCFQNRRIYFFTAVES